MFTPVPPPWYLANSSLASVGSAGSSARSANSTYIHDVYLNTPASLTSFSIQHDGVSAGNLDLGIYDTNGNLLAKTGITSAIGFTNAVQTIALSQPLALGSGRYYFAFWVDNGTDTYFARQSYSQAFVNILNANNLSLTGLGSSFTAMGGVGASTVWVPFLGHLSGTGF